MNPVEQRIRAPSGDEVYDGTKEAFPEETDIEIIAELMRMTVFVAVCYNDVVEDGQNPAKVFDRRVFTECDALANYFPWRDD